MSSVDNKKRTRVEEEAENGDVNRNTKLNNGNKFDSLESRFGNSDNNDTSIGFGSVSKPSNIAPINNIGSSSFFQNNAALSTSVVHSSEHWKCNSNDILTLQIADSSFPPIFTYPFFGQEETIFGYKGLRIKLEYTPGSLDSFLKISYLEKLDDKLNNNGKEELNVKKQNDENKLDDIEGLLKEQLTTIIENEKEFNVIKQEKDKKFRPIGELKSSYKKAIDGKLHEFEIYKTSLNTEGFKDYLMKMQGFLLFFIEAATYVDDDERWEFFTLYEKVSNNNEISYKFLGYTSLFPFFYYPDKIRMRLSQFLILPPYQRRGHGSELYRTVYKYVVENPNIVELTVEDPNEYFDFLRDRSDILLPFPTSVILDENKDVFNNAEPGKSILLSQKNNQLIKSSNFKGIPILSNEEETGKLVEQTRKSLKLTKRQSQRCLEILQLQRILYSRDHFDEFKEQENENGISDIKKYRLNLKRRIYQINEDTLSSVDDITRKEKLQESYQSVKEGYDLVLKSMNWGL